MGNAKFVKGKSKIGAYAIKFIGQIVAIHFATKTEYLPDQLFPGEFIECTTANAYGGGSATALSSTYFNNTGENAEGYVPDLSDDRFLQGSSTYARSGTNEHNHRWSFSTAGENAKTWQSDGSTTQNINLVTASNYGGGGFTVFNGRAIHEYWTENYDSRPQYFSVRYFMRIG